jgi:outer membrane protein OmpA-like peptidoglycan-associated protein
MNNFSIIGAGLTGIFCLALPALAATKPAEPLDSRDVPEYRVFFERSDKLDGKSLAFIQSLAKIAAKNNGSIKEIVVEGHASRTGAEEANRRVSMLRAETVAGIFTSAGMKPEAIRVTAFGSSQPVDELPASHAEQRRATVAFQFSDDVTGPLSALQELAKSSLEYVSVEKKGLRARDEVILSSTSWKPVNGVVDPRTFLPATEILAVDRMAKALVKSKKTGGFIAITMPASALGSKAGRETFARYNRVLKQIGVSRRKLLTRFDSRSESIEIAVHTFKRNQDVLALGAKIAETARNSAAIRLVDKRPVARFAPFLAKNSDLWSQVEVVNGGPKAEQVRAALIRQGVPAKRIKTRPGYLNRRVIVSVSSSQGSSSDIQKILDEALQRTAH